ncbi:MAG: hypothetical protein HYY04_13115 [Chloroflexi bacterium]|nr:hypothetical protein [Chloroflexota bacterium]
MVNRYLLAGPASAGRGAAEVAGLNGDIKGVVIGFQDRPSFPMLTDLRLELSGDQASEIHPSPLPS